MRNATVIILTVVGISVALWALPAFSAEGGFTVSRLVVGTGVQDREPVGVAETFTASDDKVYCFLEATDIEEDTSVSFVWFHEESETARVEVPLGKSPRWRTYSSKLLGGQTGQWKIELQDPSGNILNSVSFEVN
jgi:hypothetical protein